MIETFEQYTAELNDKEKEIFPLFVSALRKHVGRDSAVSNSAMQKGMKEWTGISFNGARIRKMINTIQCRGLIPHLVSCSKGYYVADSREDIVRYVASIRSRANSIYEVANSVMHNENIGQEELGTYLAEYYDGQGDY